MGNMSGSYGSHYTLWQSITQNSQDIANNKSNVTVNMYLSFDGSSYYAYTNNATSGNMTINGSTTNYSIASINFSSGQVKDILLATWTGDIEHNPDGTKTLSVSGSWNTDTSRIGSGTCSASQTLTTIPRYANLTSLSVKSRTADSITFSFTSDKACRIFAKIESPVDTSWLIGGGYFIDNKTSGEFTIYYADRASTTRLSPDTTYKFTILCRNVDSGLDTAKEISATTLGYAKFTKLVAKSKTVNLITISWACDVAVDDCQYSLNGGSYNGFGISYPDYTIKNLSPNTTYKIKLKAKRRDSGLYSESETITVTTYDIAKISSLSNFEHGSSPTVSITNPGSISSLSLVMKVGDTQILSRTVSAGNNAITFIDTELDNLYKKYGSGNSLTATFVLSGDGYTNTKTCTITLKGNQKTMRTNVSSTWKRGKIWANVNGTWKRGVLWTNVNGTWKRGI